MALSQSALSELLDAIRAGGSEEVIREAMALVLQELIELEARQAIGADRYQRTDERTTHRNGSSCLWPVDILHCCCVADRWKGDARLTSRLHRHAERRWQSVSEPRGTPLTRTLSCPRVRRVAGCSRPRSWIRG
jgi:hypothetical protein